MRIATATLEKGDMDHFSGKIPAEVIRNAGVDGYYTIGAIDEAKNLLGVAQFCVGTGEKGHTEAGLCYIYVEGEVRKRGVGDALLSVVFSVLRKSGIERIFAFPGKDDVMKSFLRSAGFQKIGSNYYWKGKKVPVCWMRRI